MPTEDTPPSQATSEPTRSRLWAFITNPVTNFVIGIGGILIGAIFYWLSLASVEPLYRASPVEVIARRESPRLTVAWDGVAIENLCVLRVGMWNRGKIPLTQNHLTDSDPLRIESSKPIRILSIETTNVSRSTLTFSHGLQQSTALIRINGNDALDTMDGGVFRLLFTGDCNTAEFSVKGRVIGSRGFTTAQNPGLWAILGIMGPLILSFAVILSLFARIVDPMLARVRTTASSPVILNLVNAAIGLIGVALAFGLSSWITVQVANILVPPTIPVWIKF